MMQALLLKGKEVESVSYNNHFFELEFTDGIIITVKPSEHSTETIEINVTNKDNEPIGYF